MRRATPSVRRARIIVMLINAMAKRGEKKGVAALCIGAGATAVAIERMM